MDDVPKPKEIHQFLNEYIIGQEVAKKALEQTVNLKGLEAHSTVILSQIDADTFRKLGINLTCEPQYQSKKLYHK